MDGKSPEELLQGLLSLPQELVTQVVKVAGELLAWERLGLEGRGQRSECFVR